jgi:cyclopropane-fatty-acyl-phospholipid synthase
MQRILDRILSRLVTRGSLRVTYPGGDIRTYGSEPGPDAAFAVRDRATLRRIVANPGLAFGEAYMDGGIEPQQGRTIYDVLDVLLTNTQDASSAHPVIQLRARLDQLGRRIRQFNPARRARRNVAHHYDLNGRLYRLLLDRDRQYSCAYFPRGDETLDEAQVAKKRHIASKLLLDRPGLSVLDIGCGWGGMALTLARDHGARVLGITLSAEQLEAARTRAEAEGLGRQVRFELLDYRAVGEQFDRIVSVGMFEHVGVVHYKTFFQAVRRCLKPDGVALIHAIGRSEGPGVTNPWLRKYIFPGGYSPALSEVLPAAEKSGLIATDIEILRLHYAKTLRLWRANLSARRDAIAALYDERFCRMFEFYLAACELAFRRQDHMIWQLQLAQPGAQAVPLTRDYMVDAERRAANAAAAATRVSERA